jgi:hypothetical protein
MAALGPAEAELPAVSRRAAERYLHELARVEATTGRVSMQRLFLCADSLDEAFFGRDSTSSIEWLSEPEIDSLGAELPGIAIVLNDYAFSVLDSSFFLPLFESRGLPTDVEFMRIYARRDLGQEGVGGCLTFGEDRFVNQHAAWREFAARHPNEYEGVVAEEDGNVLDALAMSTCVCGDSLSYQAELRRFLERFPHDPDAPRIEERLEAVRKGTASVEYSCFWHGYH